MDILNAPSPSKPIFLAPITLYGEGAYAISAVKKIEVTDEYLGLDEDVRKCQNLEPFENCTTRQYLQAVQNECNCVLYPMRQFIESLVSFHLIIVYTIYTYYWYAFRKTVVFCNNSANMH